MGRPHKYANPATLQKHIDDYFEVIKTEKRPPTISGLCYHLGYADISEAYKLRDHPIFGQTYKRAHERLVAYWEELLARGCNNGGAIFALKNIAGWRDNVDVTSGGEKLQSTQVIISGSQIGDALNNATKEIANADG